MNSLKDILRLKKGPDQLISLGYHVQIRKIAQFSEAKLSLFLKDMRFSKKS